jgi:hypothetical protein
MLKRWCFAGVCALLIAALVFPLGGTAVPPAPVPVSRQGTLSGNDHIRLVRGRCLIAISCVSVDSCSHRIGEMWVMSRLWDMLKCCFPAASRQPLCSATPRSTGCWGSRRRSGITGVARMPVVSGGSRWGVM